MCLNSFRPIVFQVISVDYPIFFNKYIDMKDLEQVPFFMDLESLAGEISMDDINMQFRSLLSSVFSPSDFVDAIKNSMIRLNTDLSNPAYIEKVFAEMQIHKRHVKEYKLLKKKIKNKQESEEDKQRFEFLQVLLDRSSGMNTGRVEGYKKPILSNDELSQINADRVFLRSLKFTPTDAFEIAEISRSKWVKPLQVECYNIDRKKLIELGKDKIRKNQTINIASIHGASHSMALLVTCLNKNIDVDFYYHADLEMEMKDELNYVRHVVLNILANRKIPLVIVKRGENVKDIFYHRGAFPTVFKRWCTNLFKVSVFKELMFDLWGDMLFATKPLGSKALSYRVAKRASTIEILKARGGSLDANERDEMDRLKDDIESGDLDGVELASVIQRLAMLSERETLDSIIEKFDNELKYKIEYTKSGRPSYSSTGKHALIANMIGIQSHQSISRSHLNPYPTMSDMSERGLLVFNIMPVYRVPLPYQTHPDYDPEKKETYNLILLKEIGAMRNVNERRWGRHGCVCCNFAGWPFFQFLKENDPDEWHRAIEIRDQANKKYFEEGKGKTTKYEIYRIGHEITKEAMEKYKEETGKDLTESPF